MLGVTTLRIEKMRFFFPSLPSETCLQKMHHVIQIDFLSNFLCCCFHSSFFALILQILRWSWKGGKVTMAKCLWAMFSIFYFVNLFSDSYHSILRVRHFRMSFSFCQITFYTVITKCHRAWLLFRLNLNSLTDLYLYATVCHLLSIAVELPRIQHTLSLIC